MTRQELFDRVATHLLEQDEKSEGVGQGVYRCLYRGPNELRCAIGVLIPNDKYNPSFEGCPCTDKDIQEAAGLGGEDINLALQLQDIHDGNPTVLWRGLLQETAAEFGLKWRLG